MPKHLGNRPCLFRIKRSENLQFIFSPRIHAAAQSMMSSTYSVFPNPIFFPCSSWTRQSTWFRSRSRSRPLFSWMRSTEA